MVYEHEFNRGQNYGWDVISGMLVRGGYVLGTKSWLRSGVSLVEDVPSFLSHHI